MFNQLVLPIVANTACITPVGLLVSVSSLMIIAITDRCESLCAVLALIRLLPSVDSDVHQKVPPLVELFIAVAALVVWYTLRILLRL